MTKKECKCEYLKVTKDGKDCICEKCGRIWILKNKQWKVKDVTKDKDCAKKSKFPV